MHKPATAVDCHYQGLRTAHACVSCTLIGLAARLLYLHRHRHKHMRSMLRYDVARRQGFLSSLEPNGTTEFSV